MITTEGIDPPEYPGNGSITAFAYPIKVLNSAHLIVELINDSTGVVTTKTLTTHYTLTGVGSESGVTVTMITPPATGETLRISESLPIVQETDYVRGSRFPEDTIENDFDYQTKLHQAAAQERASSIKLARGETDITDAKTRLPVLAPNKILATNSTGTGFAFLEPGTSAPTDAASITYNQGGTGATDQTQAYKNSLTVHVTDFMTDAQKADMSSATPSVDSYSAFAAAWAKIQDTGGELIIPRGSYLLDTQWIIDGNSQLVNARISGFGAKLFAGSSVTGHAVKITGFANNFGLNFEGFQFNHRGNATVGGCIEIRQNAHAMVINCSVEHHDTKAGYSGILIQTETAGDGNTSAFWTVIDGFKTRKRSGGDGTDAACGIKLGQSANATKITNCSFTSVTDAIILTGDGVSTSGSNAVRIIENDFEGVSTCVRFDTAELTSLPVGIQLAFNRVESADDYIAFGTRITAATQANPCSITAAGHGMTTGGTSYIDGVLGMTELNGNSYTVTVVDVDTYTLDATDSTAYTAYSSGGFTTESRIDSGYGVSLFTNYLTIGSVTNYLVNPASQFVWSYEPSFNGVGARNYLGGPSDFRIVTEGTGKNLVLGNISNVSNWAAGHIVMGAYHLWVDTSTGKLMLKNGAPASTSDGTVVGTQS